MAETPPDVSVIVPVRDAADVVGTQLDAFSAQIDAPAFEVLICDNGSTDYLEGAVAPYRDRLSIRLLDASAHRGAAFARNVGIGAARGSLLLFCDADDAVGSRFVAHGRRTLEETPVFSGSAVHVEHADVAEGIAHVRRLVDDPPHWTRPRPQDEHFPILHGAVFGLRADLARSIGGFDAGFWRGAEDNDLALRLQDRGVTVPVSYAITAAYCGHRSEAHRRRERFRVGLAHARLCSRHHRWGTTPTTSAHRPLSMLLRALAAMVRSRLRADAEVQSAAQERVLIASGLLLGRVRFTLRPPVVLIGLGLRGPDT